MCAVGRLTPAIFVSIYGWASGVGTEERWLRTSGLVQAVLDELEQWPAVPHFVLGDVNGPTDK
eukprot:3289893-Alexandrium_andersonii.AAC.1